MKCTYCGGDKFYEGPSGGMSTNVLCANPSCRHWFNLTPIADSLEDLHRIEPSNDEKTAAAKAREGTMNLGLPRMLVSIDAIIREGHDLYKAGRSALDCMQESPYGGYGAAQSNMLRMCGWLDAMREDKP